MPAPPITAILLTRGQRRQLYRIRRRASPQEGCALLLGHLRSEDNTVIVTRIVETDNVDRSHATFSIDPEDQYRILEEAARDRLELVAIFHSHPAPPRPSRRDLQYMVYNPCVWIIDGIRGGRRKLMAYQLIEGKLHQVEIKTV